MATKRKKHSVDDTTKLEKAIKKASKECSKYLFEFKKYEKIALDSHLLKEFCSAIKRIQLSGRSGILRGGKTKQVKDRIKEAQEKLKGKQSWENGCPLCGSKAEVCVVCISRVLEEVEKQTNKHKKKN